MTQGPNYYHLFLLIPLIPIVFFPMVISALQNDANDIALLKLDKPLDLHHKDANALCLPKPNQKYDKSSCTVAGWGRKSKF